MKYRNILFATFLISTNTLATTVDFDFRDILIEGLDESVSFPLTAGGITVTLTANDGELNRTTSGFGVNASIAGDDTDGMEAGETIGFIFDTDILFTGFTVSAFGGIDSGIFSIPGQPNTLFSSTGFIDAGNFLITAGDIVTIFGDAGSYSLDSMTIDTVSAVPLPAAFYLFASGFALLTLSGRRKKSGDI